MKNYIHPHYFSLIIEKLVYAWTGFVARLLAMWWGVKLGKGGRFHGIPIFRVIPGTNISVGDNVVMNSSHSSNLIGVYTPCMFSTISRNGQIHIGNDCGFSGTVIASAISITIGNNVRCGANTLITDSDWHSDDSRIAEDAPVIIENDVWLGYGVKVLKGVTIGRGSLIGAGSIVTSSIPAGVIAAGNPCKVIRQI